MSNDNNVVFTHQLYFAAVREYLKLPRKTRRGMITGYFDTIKMTTPDPLARIHMDKFVAREIGRDPA